MKKLFLSLIFLTLAGSVYAQLNTFSDGDIVSAEKMNENFDFVIKDIRATKVYCNGGETIKSALESGFNYLTIYGICTDQIVAINPVDPVEFGENRELSPPLGHIVIKGGEDNRGATLGEGSIIASAFQSSLQLVNLTIQEHVSASYGSMIHLKDVSINKPGNEIYVTENSILIVENSDIQIPVVLKNGSLARLRNIEMSVSSNSAFFELSRGSILEMESVNITHRSDNLNFNPQRNDLTSVASLVTAIGNSSVSVTDSTIQTTTSAAFLIVRGSEIELNDSTVISDSFLSTFIINAKLDIKNSTMSNTINEAIGMIEGSSGYISDTTITGTGDQAIFVSGSDLTIENSSRIGLSGNTENGKETILMTRGAFVEISDSTVENTSTGLAVDIEKSSSLMAKNTTIHSTNDGAIFVSQGSKLFANSGGDSLNIDRISDTTNIDIFALKQSSLFFGNNNYAGVINIDCSSFVDISDSSNVTGCSE